MHRFLPTGVSKWLGLYTSPLQSNDSSDRRPISRTSSSTTSSPSSMSSSDSSCLSAFKSPMDELQRTPEKRQFSFDMPHRRSPVEDSPLHVEPSSAEQHGLSSLPSFMRVMETPRRVVLDNEPHVLFFDRTTTTFTDDDENMDSDEHECDYDDDDIAEDVDIDVAEDVEIDVESVETELDDVEIMPTMDLEDINENESTPSTTADNSFEVVENPRAEPISRYVRPLMSPIQEDATFPCKNLHTINLEPSRLIQLARAYRAKCGRPRRITKFELRELQDGTTSAEAILAKITQHIEKRRGPERPRRKAHIVKEC